VNSLHSLTASVPTQDDPQARFGARVAVHLNRGTRELPHDIGERLRASRERALARRRAAVGTSALSPTGRADPARPATSRAGGWWTRIASALPVVALVAGLVAIKIVQDENRANEVAEVDAALLSGELPPAAYTDPGFAQFLKTDADTTVR